MFNKKGIGISNDNNKKKIIIISAISIALVLSIVVLITTGVLSKLMGNSITEYYCEDTSYKLEGNKCVKEIKDKSALLGDVNLDNKVTHEDLDFVKRYINYIEYEEPDEEISKLTPLQIKAADVSEDNDIYNLDYDILSAYLESNTSTHGMSEENIGVKRICSDGFKLEGIDCIKKDVVDAKIKTTEVNTTEDTSTSITDTTNNNDNTNNLINNPVEISFKPEDELTSLNVYRNYKISVNFKINDKTKPYYYIWRTYKYDENDFSTECKLVTEGDHLGNFIMNGTKKVNVSIYSDSTCKNQVTTMDSKKYTCVGCTNGINVSLIPENDKTLVAKDSNYKMNLKFNINDKGHKYYYIWSNYLNGVNNYNSACTEAKEGEHGGSFKVNGYRRVKVTVYSDSTCKNRVKDVESKTYAYEGISPNARNDVEAFAWIEHVKYRTRNVLTGKVEESTKNTKYVPANSDIFVRFNFMIKDSTKQYYYKYNVLAMYDSDEQKSSCLPIPKSLSENKIFTLKYNGKNRTNGYGYRIELKLYEDSNCSVRMSGIPDNTIVSNNYDIQYFNVKYNANGGKLEDSSLEKYYYNYKKKIPIDVSPTKGLKIYKNGYDLIGFKVKNSKGLFMCYTNGNKSSQDFTNQSNCNKYGYVIYTKGDSLARTTSNNGETLQFIAEWTKNPVSISVTPLNYNTYKKGTHITSKVTFKVNDTNNNYYYQWGYRKVSINTNENEYKNMQSFLNRYDAYSNISSYWYGLPSGGKNESLIPSYWNLDKYSCKKITNNLSFSPTIRVDKSVNAGIVIVYSDSSCEYPIGSIQNVHKLTGFYRCAPNDNNPWGGCVN